MRKVKFAIIGCGSIGERHAKHASNFGELVAVVDIKSNRKDNLKSRHNCMGFSTLNDLLSSGIEFDVLSICTPNILHAEHTVQGLKAGKHVVCEKPMATKVKDCEMMISESINSKKMLFVVKQNRYNPPIVALKKVLEENRLGKILNIQLNCFWNRGKDYFLESDWKGDKTLDGGILFTQFSHFLDLLLWMVGDIKNVYAIKRNFLNQDVIDLEDTGVVALEFECGALGTINYTINSFGKNMEGSITMFGERGTVKIGGQYLNTLEYQNIKDYKIEINEVSATANDYGTYQGSMSNHDKVYKNVIDVLVNNAALGTNGIEGMKVVQLIEKINSVNDVL